MNYKRLKSIIPISILSVIAVYITSTFYLYSKNNLLSKDWNTLKIENQSYVLGSIQYFTDRFSVAQNKLRLNAYYGFNGIYIKKYLKTTKISFDIELDEESYLLMYLRKGNISYGVKISKNSKHKSFLFKMKDGLYINKEFISLKVPLKGKIVFSIKDNKLYIDKKPIKLPHFFSLDSKFQVVFQGGDESTFNKVFIDNINIETDEALIYEDFSNNFNKEFVYLVFSILLMPFILILFLKKGLKLHIYLFYIFYIFIISTLYLFDYYYWSTKFYYQISPNAHAAPEKLRAMRLENFRKKFFYEYFNINSQHLTYSWKYYNLGERSPYIKNSNCVTTYFEGEMKENFKSTCNFNKADEIKIAFIGSSQTAGSGASKYNTTFVQLFTSYLYEEVKRSNRCNLSVMNMSKSGSSTKTILQSYLNNHKKTKYDFIFINYGFNDSWRNYKKNLKILSDQLNSEYKIFVGEPSRITYVHSENYNQTYLLANELNSTFIATKNENWLKDNDNLGLFFWDKVHLTDVGHKYLADTIFRNSIEYIKKNNPCF